MTEARIDRRMVTILAIVFVNILGASMILPILTLYAINELGVPEQQAPLLQAAFFVAQFIASPFLGRLSDRFGRVPVLFWSQVGTVASFLMIAFAPTIGMVYASRILDGITGGNILVAQAYVIDITPREKRTQSLGLIFAVFGLGFIFGPSIGGALAALVGRQATFLIAALLTMVPTVMTYFMLTETMTAEQRQAARARGGQMSFGEMIKDRTIFSILLLTMFGSVGLGIVQTTFAIYGQNILFLGSDENTVNLGVGLMLGVVGLGQTITQVFLLRRLLRRFGDAPLVLGGTLIRTVAMTWYVVIGLPFVVALVGQAAVPITAIPAALMFAIGTGIMMPPLQSLVTFAAPDSARGAVVGLTSAAQSLGVIIGTLAAGPLLGITIAGRPSLAPYTFNAVMFLLLAIPALGLIRRFGAKPLQRISTATEPAAAVEH
ncbi:MAG: MFS transporter [Chloroflexi bacterium]|nr:MFS transporter [Chloroflexota bacterium]